ncbi:MAG: hypothetical protein ABIN95_02170 [Mucilaginibacter sp.]
MRKLIPAFIAILSTGLYILSSDTRLMLHILYKRANLTSAVGTDRVRYGDLYRMSYLSAFKSADPLLQDIYTDTLNNIKRDINLYALCDSYLLSFVHTGKVFTGVKKFWGARAVHYEKPVLDTTQKNILLIEMTERYAELFTNYKLIEAHFAPVAPGNRTDTLPTFTKLNYGEPDNLLNKIFNPKVQESLEFNLFDYRFLTPLKELKANFNYTFFNRINPGVAISPGGKYLFLASTVNSASKHSSFSKIDEKYIDTLVTSFNHIYHHYKHLGFDEVYLSIIPNPVTIVAPQMGEYNMLIPRIQDNPALKMPYIDVYKKFKATRQPIYQYADTHWNKRGYTIWVNELNKAITANNKKIIVNSTPYPN